jgi:hypothetical protein
LIIGALPALHRFYRIVALLALFFTHSASLARGAGAIFRRP